MFKKTDFRRSKTEKETERQTAKTVQKHVSIINVINMHIREKLVQNVSHPKGIKQCTL